MWYENAQKHYKNAAYWYMEFHDVSSTNLPVLAHELRTLLGCLNENPDGDELNNLCQTLYWLLKKAISTPVYPSELLVDRYSMAEIENLALRIARYLPQTAKTLDKIMLHLSLWSEEEPELLLCLMALSERFHKADVAFEVTDNRFRGSIQNHFDDLGIPFKLVTKGKIKGETNHSSSFSHLVMAGEAYWYTSKILLPPAANVHILTPAWARTKGPAFPTPFAIGEAYIEHAEKLSTPEFVHHKEVVPQAVQGEMPEESELFTNAIRTLIPAGLNEKYVTARAYQLANDKVTFFQVDSRLHLLEIDSERNVDVEFISACSVRSGHVLLVKNRDNQLSSELGDQELALVGCDWQKKMQEWKKPLEKQTTVYGYEHVISKLKLSGSRRANYQNLNNWINETKLTPKHDDDFLSILHLVGMPERLAEFKAMASRVKGARLAAAHQIRDLLTEKLSEINLQQLYETGIQPLSLFDDDESYTALRVEQVFDGYYQVPTSLIRQQRSPRNTNPSLQPA